MIMVNESDLSSIVSPSLDLGSLVIEPDPLVMSLDQGLTHEEELFINGLIDSKKMASSTTPICKDLTKRILKCYLSGQSYNEILLDEAIDFTKKRLEAFANNVDLFSM